MASGKNHICSQLEKQGWKSIDADLLVHQAIKIKTQEIIDTFREPARESGIDFINQDGSINRRLLGQLLFNKPELLELQEKIVYPEVTRLTLEFISSNQKSIINATVLYKTPSLLEKCDSIIFINAPFLKRLLRSRKRDRLPYRQIFRRFKAQKNLLDQYMQNSDKTIYILNNS